MRQSWVLLTYVGPQFYEIHVKPNLKIEKVYSHISSHVIFSRSTCLGLKFQSLLGHEPDDLDFAQRNYVLTLSWSPLQTLQDAVHLMAY